MRLIPILLLLAGCGSVRLDNHVVYHDANGHAVRLEHAQTRPTVILLQERGSVIRLPEGVTVPR